MPDLPVKQGAAIGRRPSLFYRATGRLNQAVWRMPLPRRVLARLSKFAYRNPPMPLAEVHSILDALERVDVPAALLGGWAVDALAGSQSRIHRDLDLVVDERDMPKVMDALGSLGYTEWYRIDSDGPLHRRVVLHDHELAGRAVDIHPVEMTAHTLTFAAGALDGRSISCLSHELQLSTRRGYRKRRVDRRDLAVLRRVLTRPATALIVPVPAADHLVEDSAREAGMPAHITLIYPFVPAGRIDEDTAQALGEVFAGAAPFEFVLTRVGTFPGVVYLAPEPARPFVELSQLLAARWPEHQPYGGAYGRLVPHATIAYGEQAPPRARSALPIDTEAREVWLMTRTPGSWAPRARFALGGGLQGEQASNLGAAPSV